MKLLKKLLNESNYTVIFTGAGMSTESNLPDFRSAASGLWNKFDPLKLATVNAMRNNQEEFKEFYTMRIEAVQNTEPHIGHYIFAEWEEKGLIQSIITQNVDGFHQRAGSKKVAELHGTLRHCNCHDCGQIYPNERFLNNETTCKCGGFIRPSVVLFGENLPDEALDMAEAEAKKADLFIVFGSSLQVSPANYFPSIAKRNGAKLVIVNMEPTPLDDMADLVINGRKIGVVLMELDK
ncbi:NAD-dependent deacetylase [Tepidibacillus infernus]|uniref:SIR2 family NAD-dependent protein deacylase n=1 Tax=Tepidibacillus infernus TaxID=1806172 RepID=UPI003A3181C7